MIVFITGPMFSSKSRRIEEYYRAATYNGSEDVLVFKPFKDTRDDGVIAGRGSKGIEAIKIKSILDITKYLKETTTDIFIDEINFFENLPDDSTLRNKKCHEDRQKRIHKTILLLEYLNYEKGINIFLAGLNFNSERKPFGIAPYLMGIANSIDNLNARCVKCKSPGTHTNFKGIKDAEVVVGSDEYEPLCAKHWFMAQKKKDEHFIDRLYKN